MAPRSAVAAALRAQARTLDALADELESGEQVKAPAPTQPPALLDRTGIAHEIKVSLSKLDRLVAAGMPYTLAGSAKRFRLADVLAWLDAPESKPQLRAIGGGR